MDLAGAGVSLELGAKPDLGHKPEFKFSEEKKKGEAEGISQKEFNERMNDPKKYQWEPASENRSHQYEKKLFFTPSL